MSCDWCSFPLSLVFPGFTGYSYFDADGNFMREKCCSLNCCVAFIQRSDYQVDDKLKHLKQYYSIFYTIEPAKPRRKLSKFGGNLTYVEYRRNFICPSPDENEEYYSEEDDYDNDY